MISKDPEVDGLSSLGILGLSDLEVVEEEILVVELVELTFCVHVVGIGDPLFAITRLVVGCSLDILAGCFTFSLLFVFSQVITVYDSLFISATTSS